MKDKRPAPNVSVIRKLHCNIGRICNLDNNLPASLTVRTSLQMLEIPTLSPGDYLKNISSHYLISRHSMAC